MRRPLSTTILLSVLALAGCSPGASRKDAVADPGMWYRFKFEAEYRGKPVRFDQFVHCGVVRVPGGSLGATPSVTTRGMHPETVGRQMEDGSHIVLRLPDLCLRHRRYRVNGPYLRGGRLPGWESRGPFSLLPLVIWNDRRPSTTRVESYVSPLYYRQPGARITNAKGSVEFMPLGFRPANAAAIIAQSDEPAYDQGPKLNPATGKPWGPRERNYLSAEAIVPASDMNSYYAETGAQKARFGKDASYLPSGRMTSTYQHPGPPFTIWNWTNDTGLVWKADHRNYLPPAYLVRCIEELQSGFPGVSDLPPDPYDYDFYDTPGDVENERNGAAEARRRGGFIVTHPERIQWEYERRKSCYDQLGKLRSFAIVDHRFEPAELPGMLVYRPWASGIMGTPFPSEYLKSQGVLSVQGYPVLRLNGAELPYMEQSNIVEDQRTGRWYLVNSFISVVHSRFE